MVQLFLQLAAAWSEFLMLWTGEVLFWISAAGLAVIALVVWYLRYRRRP